MKIRLHIGIIGLSLCLLSFWFWNSGRHHNVIVTVHQNMVSMQKSVEAYASRRGQFPTSMDADLKRELAKQGFQNNPCEFFHEGCWIKAAHDTQEALLLAKGARPGQVIYCPISKGALPSDYAIMGENDRGELVIASVPTVRTLVLTHSN